MGTNLVASPGLPRPPGFGPQKSISSSNVVTCQYVLARFIEDFFIPEKIDGSTAYALTLKDVPINEEAFWSISVYNQGGFFVENKHNKYVINNRKATHNDDGSVTIHFGGNPEQPNFRPIMEDWNYAIRIYLPQKAYFDGSWQAPEAQLAQ